MEIYTKLIFSFFFTEFILLLKHLIFESMNMFQLKEEGKELLKNGALPPLLLMDRDLCPLFSTCLCSQSKTWQSGSID